MGDPFRKVTPGEPVTFSATAWNAALDAGLAVRRSEFDRGPGFQPPIRQANIIKIRNDTGTDIDRPYSILGIGSALISPSVSEDGFILAMAFSGVSPLHPYHTGRYAILLEPVDDGKIVKALVAGICQVRLNLTDPDHTCAEVEAGNVECLVSDEVGSAQILWKESDDDGYGYTTGEQWAVIRFGSTCGLN